MSNYHPEVLDYFESIFKGMKTNPRMHGVLACMVTEDLTVEFLNKKVKQKFGDRDQLTDDKKKLEYDMEYYRLADIYWEKDNNHEEHHMFYNNFKERLNEIYGNRDEITDENAKIEYDTKLRELLEEEGIFESYTGRHYCHD